MKQTFTPPQEGATMKTNDYSKPYIDTIKRLNLMDKDEWTIKELVGVLFNFLYIKSDMSLPDLRPIFKDKSIAMGLIPMPIPELFSLIGINHPPLSDEPTIWVKKGSDFTLRLTKDSFSRYTTSDALKLDRKGVYTFLDQITEILTKDLQGDER